MKNHWRGQTIDRHLINAMFKVAFAIHNKEKEVHIQDKIITCNFRALDMNEDEDEQEDEYELNKTR